MKTILAATLVLALTPIAHAQFGGLVYDPTQALNVGKQIQQGAQLYSSAKNTEQQVIQQYNLAKQMATAPVSAFTQYANSGNQQWTPVTPAANTYGNTQAWITAATTGRGAAQANQSASIPTSTRIDTSRMAPESQQAIAARGATIDLNDAANTTTLQTLGAIRAAAPQYEADIQKLEAATHSTNPLDQTQAAQLQRINQALLLQLRAQQQIMQMQQATAMQQIVQQKDHQDGLKQALQNGQPATTGYYAPNQTGQPLRTTTSTSH